MSIHVIHAGNGLHLCAIPGVRSPCLYYNYIHALYEPIHKLVVTVPVLLLNVLQLGHTFFNLRPASGAEYDLS